MFFKSKRQGNPGPSRSMAVEPSFLGRNCSVEGHLLCDGELHIDGTVRGRVQARLCVVDRHGVVSGDISGEVIHVRGRVIGPIQGGAIYIYNGAHIEGDVFNDSISIEPGAYVEGAVRRNPMQRQGQGQPSAFAPQQETADPVVEEAKPGRKFRLISTKK